MARALRPWWSDRRTLLGGRRAFCPHPLDDGLRRGVTDAGLETALVLVGSATPSTARSAVDLSAVFGK